MLTRVIIIAMLLATACAPVPVQNSASNTPPPQDKVEEVIQGTTEPSESTRVPSPAADDGLQKKITAIVTKDLAAQLGISADRIRVISIEVILWPNAALGCPRPGKVYAQGAVSGFRIRLKAENKEYSYHTDRTGQFVSCPKEDPELQERPSIPVTPGEIDDGEPWVPVN